MPCCPRRRRGSRLHEAGHALVALLSEHADPVAKITILPLGPRAGVTEQLPVDERHLYSESYLRDSLAIRLGGRASELVVLGEASTGAANDLSGATELAIRTARDWGLSPRLGPVGFGPEGPGVPGGRPATPGTPLRRGNPASHRRGGHSAALGGRGAGTLLLSENRRALDALVDLLLERVTINGQDLVGVVERSRLGTGTSDEPVHAVSVGLTVHLASRKPS